MPAIAEAQLEKIDVLKIKVLIFHPTLLVVINKFTSHSIEDIKEYQQLKIT